MDPIDLQSITPCIYGDLSSPTLVTWLESNFISVYKITKHSYQYFYGLRNQPGVFSKPDPNILMIHTESRSPNTKPILSPRRNALSYQPHKLFVPAIGRWIDQDTFTQLPDEVVTKFTAVNLSTALPVQWIASVGKQMQSEAGTGAAKRQAMKIISQEVAAETLASFSFLDSLSEKEKISIHNALPDEVMGIKLKNMFRGGKSVDWKISKVSKEDIIAGNAIFMFSKKQAVLANTSVVREITTVCLGTFLSPTKIARYQKSRLSFSEFLQNLRENPKKLFFPEAYQKEVVSKLQGFTKYWGGAGEILDPSTIPDSFVLPDFDVVQSVLDKGEHISNEIYHSLDVSVKLKNTQEAQTKLRCANAVAAGASRLETAQRNVEELETEADNTTVNVNEYQSLISELRVQMDQHLVMIQVLEEKIARLDKQILEKDNLAIQLGTAQEKLLGFLNSATQTYNEKAKQYIADKSNSKNHFQNLLDSGILVKEITMRNSSTGMTKTLESADHTIGDVDWRFSKVHFLTTKPVPIYVDRVSKGSKAKVVYGGPYEVLITANEHGSPTMAIRLASLNSVFGFKRIGERYKAKPHPHTGSVNIYPNIQSLIDFISEYRKACLGDAESTIHSAFNQQNIKMVIAGAMAWLTSCHTVDGDEWGVEYTWFPTSKDVDVQGSWNARASNTPTIQQSLQQMQQNLTQNNNP